MRNTPRHCSWHQEKKKVCKHCNRKHKHIIKDIWITLEIKLRTFNVYVASIFLYNSETWTINQGTAREIDSFQRKLHRMVLNAYWPIKISSERVYELTKERPWNKTIQQWRRLFYWHISSLSDTISVNITVTEYYRPLQISNRGPSSHGGRI